MSKEYLNFAEKNYLKDMKKITIAIDGHSSCGKSTMAKDLAKKIGYVYVDTGAMYRAVTLFALRNNLFEEDGAVKVEELEKRMDEIKISFKFNTETQRPDTYLNGELVEKEIRGMEVSNHVSPIAAIGFVREAMVAQQQRMGKKGGIVMDGRDIGTVVFPNAELKVFVTATAEVRAQRRYDELKGKGQEADYEEILKNVQERDYIDSHREVSPLRQAEDAILLVNYAQAHGIEGGRWRQEFKKGPDAAAAEKARLKLTGPIEHLRENLKRSASATESVEAVVRFLEEEGVWKRLQVREEHLLRDGLYREAGFTEEGIRKGYYHDPPEDALIMRYSC